MLSYESEHKLRNLFVAVGE